MKRQITVTYYRAHKGEPCKCGFQGCTSPAFIVERRVTSYKGMKEFSFLCVCRVHAEMLVGLKRLKELGRDCFNVDVEGEFLDHVDPMLSYAENKAVMDELISGRRQP